MSGDMEHGTCEVCSKKGHVFRKYYHYGIECECHAPSHFEIVRHCYECKPSPPEKTTVYLTPID